MPDSPMWKPFPDAELAARDRCTGCGCHPKTQGHKEHCPDGEPTEVAS